MGEIMTSADKGRKIRDEKIIAMYEKAMGMETKPKLTAVYQRIANEVLVSYMTVYRVINEHREEVEAI